MRIEEIIDIEIDEELKHPLDLKAWQKRSDKEKVAAAKAAKVKSDAARKAADIITTATKT